MCGTNIKWWSFEGLETKNWDLVYYGFTNPLVPGVIFIINRARP